MNVQPLAVRSNKNVCLLFQKKIAFRKDVTLNFVQVCQIKHLLFASLELLYKWLMLRLQQFMAFLQNNYLYCYDHLSINWTFQLDENCQ
jgi:hypothetical protein